MHRNGLETDHAQHPNQTNQTVLDNPKLKRITDTVQFFLGMYEAAMTPFQGEMRGVFIWQGGCPNKSDRGSAEIRRGYSCPRGESEGFEG